MENKCHYDQCRKILPLKRKYCSNQCMGKAVRAKKIDAYLSGDWDGSSPTSGDLSSSIKRFILERDGYSCTKCGFDKRHPDDGRTILEVNHINGDARDHRQENLEAICPNCHALTPTYRARNLGKGREWRRELSRKRNADDFLMRSLAKKSSGEDISNRCSCGTKIDRKAKTCRKCWNQGVVSVFSTASIEELINSVKRIGYTKTAKIYGRTDNALKKYLRSQNVELPIFHKKK